MHIVSRRPSEVAAPRIGALSVLPVFFPLKDKRAIVVGGTEAAAWKAELLAAAGALVDVYSGARPCDEMARLANDGRVTLCERAWLNADFDGAALIVGDVPDNDAEALRERAHAAGAPLNVIDKPACCDFQFGSIVNRSPVVVGISTDGAAPILGQAIRRRIEALLPPTLAGWARLAQGLRPKVMEQLQAGAPRRRFWERFADLAFTPGAAANEGALGGLTSAEPAKRGHVTLVGAGPGDAEYLTIKAVRALQSADVILFDDLVSADVLELARREARRMLVGKRGGRDSCKQDDINRLMLDLARKGKHVVRLKSGDPMIFGRAGEEIAALDAAGFAVEVVPGITAASALASRLGISLTHRDAAQSVQFVTAHSRAGGLPETLDWDGLADNRSTKVFYMCRSTLPAIVDRLVDQGLPASTPVVLAANLSRPDESFCHSTLSDAPQVAASRFGPTDVCLFAVGQALGQRSSHVDRASPRQAVAR